VLVDLGDLTSSLRLSKWSLSLTPTRLDALELVLFCLSKLPYYSDEFESYGQTYLNQTGHEPKSSIIELNLDYFTTHTNFQSGEVWAEIALKTIYREPNESLSKKLTHFHISGGNFALEKNDVDQAAFHYQKVIELTDDEWFRITLAKLYATQELWQQAEYELNRVFLAEIESLDVLEYYASVHRIISTETKRELTEPINWVVNPRFSDIKWVLQGKLELSRNNKEKAILNFQRFIDMYPNHAEALELQGRTYLQLAADLQSNEHYAKAMTFLKTSLFYKSNNDALRKLIEELEREDD
jgi:tetratricopeptide (TPR) repeat protein